MIPSCILIQYNKEDKENMIYLYFSSKAGYDKYTASGSTIVSRLIEKFPVLSDFGVTASFEPTYKIDYCMIKCKNKHRYESLLKGINTVSIIPSQLFGEDGQE